MCSIAAPAASRDAIARRRHGHRGGRWKHTRRYRVRFQPERAGRTIKSRSLAKSLGMAGKAAASSRSSWTAMTRGVRRARLIAARDQPVITRRTARSSRSTPKINFDETRCSGPGRSRRCAIRTRGRRGARGRSGILSYISLDGKIGAWQRSRPPSRCRRWTYQVSTAARLRTPQSAGGATGERRSPPR